MAVAGDDEETVDLIIQERLNPVWFTVCSCWVTKHANGCALLTNDEWVCWRVWVGRFGRQSIVVDSKLFICIVSDHVNHVVFISRYLDEALVGEGDVDAGQWNQTWAFLLLVVVDPLAVFNDLIDRCDEGD